MATNRAMNHRRKPPGALFFHHRPARRYLTGNQPQSIRLWPGITLVGARDPCPKSMLVEVTSLSLDEVYLSNGTKLGREQVCKCTRLAHRLCYASVQRRGKWSHTLGTF